MAANREKGAMHQEFIKYIKSYKAGDTIVTEGEAGNAFYCLMQGKVGIWKGPTDDPDKQIRIGELSSKGAYFGEMSVLLHEPRSATIKCLEPVKVLEFPSEMLPELICQQPKLGLKLCTALADRLRGTTESNKDISEHRNELREDATSQALHARDQYRKIFVMLTSIQTQLQHPHVKSVIEYMATDKLLKGGKRQRFTESFLADIPESLQEAVRKAYADKINE
jgi:CRP-like cAMP-binding protein